MILVMIPFSSSKNFFERSLQLPKLPSSLFVRLSNLLGVRAEAQLSVTDLPVFKELVRGIPPSILVAPDGAQARLPYELSWD